jgi:hypothetical protein
MTQFLVPGAAGCDHGKNSFSSRTESSSDSRCDLVGQGQPPGPVGRRHPTQRTLRHPPSRPGESSQPPVRRGVTQLSQEAQLQYVAEVVMKYVQEMNDVCADCSSASFSGMKITVSPLRAEQDGFSSTTYARYFADTNTAMVYQQFFALHFVVQASTLFHEYLHSLPNNLAMVRNATEEQGKLPHAQRPWESGVILLERVFQERFGQRITNDKK